jgi:homogentisate 1,2-dioxygenase
MFYHSLGSIPPKRHMQVRGGGGALLTEELIGYEGFSGNESLLYHVGSPCRVHSVGPLRPIERAEWVPDTHVHRLTDSNPIAPGGDPLNSRQLLMFNADIEVSIAKPDAASEDFYRNGEGDEVIYIHSGGGLLHTVLGAVPFRERDYVVIPRGITHRFELSHAPQHWLCFHTPGEIETPSHYRNRYGQLMEHAPYSQRDFHGPTDLETFDDGGEYQLTVRVRDGYQSYVLDRHPFDVVSWDGYVFPYTFNADDFEPRTGRFHLPPPAHQTFQGPNFVICTFAPRPLDWDPEAVPLPYHHSNIQSEEVMFYAAGDYAARRGVDIGSLTLHPSGLPHGPQPGTVELALGAARTNELAVMWDTFSPLRLTDLWRANDNPEYAYSWNEDHMIAGVGSSGAGS